MPTVAATCAAYHAVKRSQIVSVLDGSPLNLERAHHAHLLFVGAFIAATLDAGLACRAAVRIPIMDHYLNSAASSGRAYGYIVMIDHIPVYIHTCTYLHI